MKKHSLKHEIKECEAAIFTIQETNFKSKGIFLVENYEIMKL